MEFKDVLTNRRSIRKFSERDVEQEKTDAMIKAALLSPSSRGIKAWEIIVVNDKDTIGRLSLAKNSGSAFLKDAKLALVVIGLPEKSDVWIEDTSIVSTILHLKAVSLGLGSCWIQIRNRIHDESMTAEEYTRKLLNIPNHCQVESIIAVGYPAEQKSTYTDDELQYNKIYLNEYFLQHFK